MPHGFCSISWKFCRTSIIPIMECIGGSDNQTAVGLLLQTATNLIEKAEEFGGKPITLEKKASTNSKVSVYFRLVFKNDECLKKFKQFIESKEEHY